MLIPHKIKDGRIRYTFKSTLIPFNKAYIRPKIDFKTSTSIWHIDEMMKRRVNDWRRLTKEDGHSGLRSELRRDGIYTGSHSIFPIPLMEYILVRYGGPVGGKVLDPFAGGPPRAIAASLMGMEYYGVDVRQEQIDENMRALKDFGLENIHYFHDDARYLTFDMKDFDVAITCPPYYNVEVYSEDEDDISTFGTYAEFDAAMMLSAYAQFEKLKPGAFSIIVVGNFRDKEIKSLIDFRGDTVRNFQDVGFLFWDDIILSKNFGSAASRASNAWKGKKLVRRHEHALVFKKPIILEDWQPKEP
jgi:DNA modification methylase